MSAKPLYTIGYEKATQQAVLDELGRVGVKLLVDTRAIAASRRAGFSKRVLAASLDEHGIGYLHLRGLGTPAEGRAASRRGDYGTLRRVYDAHLGTPEAEHEMAELIALVKSGPAVCLLCFEREPEHCHRSRIAEIVGESLGVRIENLLPPLV